MAGIDTNSLPIEMQYSDVLNQITRFYGSSSDPWNEIVLRSDSANPTRIAEEYLQQAGIKVIRTPSGRNVTYARSTVLDSYSQSPVSTPNSNVQSATTGGNAKTTLINGSATTTTEAGTKTTTFSKGAKAVGTGTKVMTVVSEASGYVFGARAGGWLGLQFSQALYDSGVSWAWSKDDWADFIQNDADDLDKAVFSFLTGIDANGNSTMYADELAVAQYYMMLREMGVFDPSGESASYVEGVDGVAFPSDNYSQSVKNALPLAVLTMPTYPNYIINKQYADPTSTAGVYVTMSNNSNPVYAVIFKGTSTTLNVTLVSKTPFKYARGLASPAYPSTDATAATTLNGTRFYQGSSNLGTISYVGSSALPLNYTSLVQNMSNTQAAVAIGTAILDGTITSTEPVDGIEKDPEASTYIDPSLINGQDRDTVLQQLKTNYPELFDGSIYQDVPQDDGTDERITYVPVPYVKPSAKPVTGSNHQNNPSVNTETNTETELDDLIKLITQLLTPTDVPDTGTGDTPPVLPPTGSASSLWAVYNPTQAQLNSFGSWLWSSNFIDQLKKLFNDPMQAIIGVHKVFATPATGGTQTIVCGYIDSEVPSAVVTSQYTTIDCGTVNLREYFGNVFDYSPFTEVSLYLPFIGIVKLDVSDVMRASIKVKYHVDVITGACLADVIVNRDSAGGVLYQYAGSAIVTYPISSGSYASAIGGILSIAGGIAATVMTGGAAAPAVLGAAAGISHLHSDVQKSGSFTGAAGAMGGKIPYLIISRPQTGMPSKFAHLQGYPVNYYTKLGSCTGHVRVSDVQVKGVNATDTELDMIHDALTQGIEI